MEIEQNQIKEFMMKAGQEIPDRPTIPSAEVRTLRIRLIAEELIELAQALDVSLRIDSDDGKDTPKAKIYAHSEQLRPPKTDLIEAYDAVLDLLVVVIGTGVAMGTILQSGWDEVYHSNMSKFTDGHRREDGKWIKGPSYSPAKLSEIIQHQIETARSKDKQLLLESKPLGG